MKKIIRHFQRMNSYDISAPKVEITSIPLKRLFESEDIDPVTKRIVRKSEFKTIDRHEEMKNFHCSDFSLENMLSAGVDMQLCTLTTSNINDVDNIASCLEKMEIKQMRTNVE